MNKTMIAVLSATTMMLGATPSEARADWRAADAESFRDGNGKEGRMGRRRGRRGGVRGMRFDPARMKAVLGLSDAQVQQIKTLRANVEAQTKAQREQLGPLRQQMRALMQADTIDAAQIYAVRSQVQSLRRLINEERFKARLQMMQLLTTEQRSKIKQRRGKRKQMFRGGSGRGRLGREALGGGIQS